MRIGVDMSEMLALTWASLVSTNELQKVLIMLICLVYYYQKVLNICDLVLFLRFKTYLLA